MTPTKETAHMLADALLLATAGRPLTEGEKELVGIARRLAQRVIDGEVE